MDCPAPNCDLPRARCIPFNDPPPQPPLPQPPTTLLPGPENPNLHQPVPLRQCLLPSDPGPCEAAIRRWFFSSSSLQCEPFTYGGCEGNDNNFQSRSQCEERCSTVEPPTPPTPDFPCPAVLCAQPEEPCLFGLARNERGCETCDCATGPDPMLVACPAIGCVQEEPCEHGVEFDQNGCPTCRCALNPCLVITLHTL